MFIHKITYYLMLLASLLLLPAGLTSCVYDDDGANGDERIVTLLLDVGETPTRTIVESALPLEKGVGIENYIDISSIKVYLYGIVNTGRSYEYGIYDTLIQELPVMGAVRMGESSTSYLVYVDVDNTKLPTGEFQLVVMANREQTCSDNSTFYNLTAVADGIYFNRVTEGGEGILPSEDKPIPMFGVKLFTTVPDFTESVDFGTVNMLRAMAKIELHCTNKVKLDNVRLTYCMPVGTCAPVKMRDCNTSQVTSDNMFLPGQENSGSQKALKENWGYELTTDNKTALPVKDVYFNKADTTGMNYMIYVPEYANDGSHGLTPAQIAFHVPSTGNDYTLEFADYSDSNMPKFNILRNHIYRYNVRLSDGKLNLKYEVIDWNEKTAGDIVFE
jgi:hypothetical protein